jgi:hypothetical protein
MYLAVFTVRFVGTEERGRKGEESNFGWMKEWHKERVADK